MKKSFIIILIFAVSLSCKKKEQPTNTNTDTYTPPPDSPYTVSTATVFSGIFNSVNNGITAVFSKTPAATFNYDSLQVKRLTCNGQPFTFNNSWLFYSCPSTNLLGSQVFSIDGANGIPSFNYTNQNNTPNCNFNFSIPDSISLSTGVTFQINNVVNIIPTGFEIILTKLWDPQIKVYKSMTNGNNTITFTPGDLSVFTSGINYDITITLDNTKALNFYGKDFKFIKQRVFDKVVKIIP